MPFWMSTLVWPRFSSDAPGVKEAKTQFDTCFAGSGAADCENLEKMFRPRIEAAPEDMELLKQTVSLMSRSQCSSEFFLQIAENIMRWNLLPRRP